MGEEANRVAVITGGAGAIGRAIEAELSIAGHTVLSFDLAGDPPVDLAHADEVRAAADRVLDRHGRCDVLVHAAAALFEDVRSRQALPRTLVPGDVAATVAFLASGAAAALTGQTLCVDGGLILR